MNNIFINLYKQFSRNKILLVIYLLAIIIFISVFASQLRFNEDVSAIIPNDERISNISSAMSNSNFADQIILHFYTNDSITAQPDSLLAYAQQVAAPLQADTQYVKNILLTVSDNMSADIYNFFYNNLPFYLTNADYKELTNRITPEGIELSLQKNFKSLVSPAGFATRKYIFKDPLNIVPMAIKRLEAFKIDDNFTLYKSGIFTKDKKHLLAFVNPVYSSSNTAKNAVLIQKIDSLTNTITTKQTEVKAEYYGGTAIAVANASVIKSDIILTVSIAALALLVFFFVLFRRVRVFGLMFVPVLLGAGVSLAVLYLFKGQISAIALGIGAVLLGVSIDYSLHFFSHLRTSQSMFTQLKELPEPIFMSSITTASAFLCLGIVKSEALNELGLFAAISVLASAFFVLTILPAIIPKKIYTNLPKQNRNTFFDKITNYNFEKNKMLIAVVLLLSVVFIFTSKNIGFNSDIASLNYMSDKLKLAEKNIESISSATLSAVYLSVSDTSLDHAMLKTEKLDSIFALAQKQQLLSELISAKDLVLSKQKQQEKIDQWNNFWEQANRQQIKKYIVEKGAKTYFKPDAFNEFYSLLDKKFTTVNANAFNPIVKNIARNYIYKKDSLYSVMTVAKVNRDNKNAFFSLFDNNNDVVIFDRQYFTNNFFELIHSDFNRLVTLSLIIVFVVLLVFFGRIELAIITFVPIVLSWVWVLGLMGIFGLEFNIFNIIISTFIFGLGIDYCIFTMRGLLNNYKYGNRSMQPFRLSIMLSAITTILGIGVLIFARHPALKSIALVSIFGILSVVSIAYVLLPVLFRFLTKFKGNNRIQAVSIVSFYMSFGTLIMFLISIVVSILLLPILFILPLNQKTKKYIYHFFIKNVLHTIIYTFPPLKKRIVNKHLLDFSKPSVIVVNHQSHIDLGMMLLLHPKIVVLTNKWVWNSPFFKVLVRYADYVPAFEGIDKYFNRLKNKVKDGYSILVFPEGTRSQSGDIRRFHQGAFYLADKLNLDIQPILQHGLQHVMPKNEFFIHRGTVTLKIMDRVKVKKIKDGETYREQAKMLTNFYRQEYKKTVEELENCDYAAPQLINKFIYKGPVLEWYCRVKLMLEKNYKFFENQIPKNAVVTDLGCGYGFLSLILKMTGLERSVYGFDYDEEKINTAQRIAEKYENINFKKADITEVELPLSDVFVISDTLHYMPKHKQEMLIQKCMKSLNKNGKIIIRDADANLKKRTKVTKFTEFLSTRFFKFNQTKFDKLSYTNATLIKKISEENGFETTEYDNAKNTSNITFVLINKNKKTSVIS